MIYSRWPQAVPVSIATAVYRSVLPGAAAGTVPDDAVPVLPISAGYPKGEKIPFKQVIEDLLDALWG